MSTRRHFIVAMLGLALVACGGSRKSRSAPIPQPRTSVRVENQGFSDMTIYAIRSGQRVRLGNAPGNSTTTFTIPSNLIFGATPLRFLADPDRQQSHAGERRDHGATRRSGAPGSAASISDAAEGTKHEGPGDLTGPLVHLRRSTVSAR